MCPTSKHAAITAGLLASVFFLVTVLHGPASPKDDAVATTCLYHVDRGHLWNRVHAAFLVRTGPDARAYGEDRLEPLLWSDSNYLLDGKPADRAVAVLEEFLRDKGESLVADPLKRAIMQRDLWLVYNWLAAKLNENARKRLEPVLAKVISRLALTLEQIAKLPDNYAAAISSNKYAEKFDPEKPDRSYLPADLFKSDGPWVCVGRKDGPTAPFHLREGSGNQFTNSTFLVFLKLPGGREKTLDFLKRLAAFDKPLVLPNPDEGTKGRLSHLPNPAMPQWPTGTEVALVRRAMLIDSSRKIVVSPLTESVQLRVMSTDAPALTAEIMDKIALRRGTAGQVFAEYQLRRADLFGEKTRGLCDVSDERDFKTGFNAHPMDEFDAPPNKDRPFPQQAQPFVSNRASCVSCHSFPGVAGFNSIDAFAFGSMRISKDDDGPELKRHLLVAMPVDKVEKAAIEWKQAQPGWKALRKLLPD